MPDTLQLRVLRNLSDNEGSSVTDVAMAAGVTVEQARTALQRLKREGKVENGYGTMGWSWFATDFPENFVKKEP
jgi:predicted ArsR family transcriptional regulator